MAMQGSLRTDDAAALSGPGFAEALIADVGGASAEFPTDLANHLPMVLEAMARMGAAPARMADYAARYGRANAGPAAAPRRRAAVGRGLARRARRARPRAGSARLLHGPRRGARRGRRPRGGDAGPGRRGRGERDARPDAAGLRAAARGCARGRPRAGLLGRDLAPPRDVAGRQPRPRRPRRPPPRDASRSGVRRPAGRRHAALAMGRDDAGTGRPTRRCSAVSTRPTTRSRPCAPHRWRSMPGR